MEAGAIQFQLWGPAPTPGQPCDGTAASDRRAPATARQPPATTGSKAAAAKRPPRRRIGGQQGVYHLRPSLKFRKAFAWQKMYLLEGCGEE